MGFRVIHKPMGAGALERYVDIVFSGGEILAAISTCKFAALGESEQRSNKLLTRSSSAPLMVGPTVSDG